MQSNYNVIYFSDLQWFGHTIKCDVEYGGVDESYKHSMIVIYNSRIVLISSQYDFRVVNYDWRTFK